VLPAGAVKTTLFENAQSVLRKSPKINSIGEKIDKIGEPEDPFPW